jgi:dCTP deaminase
MTNAPLFPEYSEIDYEPGILPWQEIKKLVEIGSISPELPDAQIQPASIDLRLGRVAYRVQASFLRGNSTTLLNKVRELLDSEIDLTVPTPQLLEPGVVYIIPLIESLRLPPDIHGIANPKSTTGRLDVFTRLITEHGDQFDRVPEGYSGQLYAEVSSRTFPIRVREGMKLNQLRFIRGGALDPLRNEFLRKLSKKSQLLYDAMPVSNSNDLGDGVQIRVDLEGDHERSIIAYKAKDSPRAIELDKIGHYDPADFWERIERPRNGRIILSKGGFYLLGSKSRVSVPLTHAAEMIAHDSSMGEFRVHYAGFFDPGFGYGNKGEISGTKAVLEVRAYEVPILLEDNDVVGRLHYYPMAAVAEKIYGKAIGSSYQEQGLALSKQFSRATSPDAKHSEQQQKSQTAEAQALSSR